MLYVCVSRRLRLQLDSGDGPAGLCFVAYDLCAPGTGASDGVHNEGVEERGRRATVSEASTVTNDNKGMEGPPVEDAKELEAVAPSDAKAPEPAMKDSSKEEPAEPAAIKDPVESVTVKEPAEAVVTSDAKEPETKAPQDPTTSPVSASTSAETKGEEEKGAQGLAASEPTAAATVQQQEQNPQTQGQLPFPVGQRKKDITARVSGYTVRLRDAKLFTLRDQPVCPCLYVCI